MQEVRCAKWAVYIWKGTCFNGKWEIASEEEFLEYEEYYKDKLLDKLKLEDANTKRKETERT